MITLITGLPGNGKTLYAIDWLRRKALAENRQVYFSGITDCKVPGWIELADPTQWYTVPSGAIVLIDEVQRVMRPRQHGTTVPEHVSRLETHRHMGVDLVFITQDPMLLDNNARRLVGQHFHVIRKFGTHMATVHEWNGVKEQAAKSRDDSIRHEWRYPADVFQLYKSAELHTHKARIPAKVWMLMSLPLVLGLLVWYLYARLTAKTEAPTVPATPEKPALMAEASPHAAPMPKLSPAEYARQFAPRVNGLAYTAPAYDEVTKAVVAPYPAACVQTATRCQCYTQQATRLETTAELCKSIAEGGFFVAWQQPVQAAVPLQARIAPVAMPEPVAGPISLGGDPRGHMKAPSSAGLPSQEQDPPATPRPRPRGGSPV